MALVRLTYFSRIRLNRLAEPVTDPVADILAASIANNRRDEVTGGLIHDKKWFAQVLEGEENAVSATFERILRDPRHSDITLVKMRPIGVRRFGWWWMAAAILGHDNASVVSQYSENERFDPPLMEASRLADLVEAMVRGVTPQQWTTSNTTNAA